MATRASPLEDAVRQAVEDSSSSGGGRPTEPCLEPDLLRALQVADQLLEERVEARMVRLRREARGLREDERARVEAYYDAVLDSIAERSDRASAERRALYEAQAEATQTERARRLQEIEDKHQPRSDRQPFRLHLLLVPAYRLPVQVRRGPRAYLYTLVWLPVLRRFLPARCPACGERATLVAGRKALGCAACVAQRTEAVPPTPGPAPAVAAVPAREPAPAERDDDGQPTGVWRRARLLLRTRRHPASSGSICDRRESFRRCHLRLLPPGAAPSPRETAPRSRIHPSRNGPRSVETTTSTWTASSPNTGGKPGRSSGSATSWRSISGSAWGTASPGAGWSATRRWPRSTASTDRSGRCTQ